MELRSHRIFIELFCRIRTYMLVMTSRNPVILVLIFQVFLKLFFGTYLIIRVTEGSQFIPSIICMPFRILFYKCV